MKETIDLKKEAGLAKDLWSPRVVGEVNGQFIKVARLKGEFIWHQHDDEDELFIVLDGELLIRYRDREDVTLRAGNAHVVPKGVQHNPFAREECLVALIEPVSTLHTGDIEDARSKSVESQIADGTPGE